MRFQTVTLLENLITIVTYATKVPGSPGAFAKVGHFAAKCVVDQPGFPQATHGGLRGEDWGGGRLSGGAYSCATTCIERSSEPITHAFFKSELSNHHRCPLV